MIIVDVQNLSNESRTDGKFYLKRKEETSSEHLHTYVPREIEKR